MHTVNFYPNFVPIQEMSDWFEHWATVGVKPAFLCEYGAPFMWDWAMYRGWYKGEREFGSAVVPWDFCLAEWNSQFLGDRAFQISDYERGEPPLGSGAVPCRPTLAPLGLPAPTGLERLRASATRSLRGTSPTTGEPSAPGACRRFRPGSTARTGSCATV